ncbi:DNA methyltransferase [Lentibacillus juripiscarius]|uniref:DNA methyltransferase n=1 Tax=Lentibacillus juripiscarius TaxID=257446 RepID=A0ABW5V3B6_9BACI
MTNENEQFSFEEEISNADNQPVVCLGMTFENDDERREYFRDELKKKLPELKEIEGFPIGEDEDIIALSDPPYYTACPNPWINDFIGEWEREKTRINTSSSNEQYHREPFTTDISEGKGDPIYSAHTYHTKVPPKAIVKYLLHYTKPGDVVLDGFSGTGMTGVAGNICGDEKKVKELEYSINSEGDIKDKNGNTFSKLGFRKTILSDLSPIATFIAKNYNTPILVNSFYQEANEIINDVEKKCGWMYETKHSNGDLGKINYMVWSQVYNCPNCTEELVFFDIAVDYEKGKVHKEFNCVHCGVKLNKKSLEKSWEVNYDKKLDWNVEQVKEVPVLINYTYSKKEYFKKLDSEDYKVLNKVDNFDIPYKFPIDRMPKGDEARRNDRTGITHVHHFYTKRNLYTLSYLKYRIDQSKHRDALLLLFTSHLINLSKLNRFRPGVSFPYNPLSGTLYIGSQNSEPNVLDAYKNKLKRFEKAFFVGQKNVVVGTSSQTNILLDDDSIDYVFTDPPFGANIMYSELSFLWESWLNVKTNNGSEAIINKSQNKNLGSYQDLMEKSFKEYYRVLKPGRWITVEFSNSKASVWNAIQEAIQKSGFVIANVSALDKQLGSFKAVTTTTAVKQDLVISAYKPKKEDIFKIKEQRNTEDSAWTFVVQHLEQLPIFIGKHGEAEFISERTPRILFDRMIAYHVQNGLPVPLSSSEFQEGISQRFPMRDGMAFLENQVAEYDKKRTLVKEFSQLSLFVSDESSAIEWIRQQLMKKPQTRQDIHPNFMKEIQHIAKHELLPELDDLLYQNFLLYEGDGSVPDQIMAYFRRNYKDLRDLESNDPKVVEKAKNRWYVPDATKQADLEKLREKSLLREFESYLEQLEGNKKKLKQFRTEAVRAGFKKAYSDKDFEKIVKIGERLPEKIIQEDDKLLMYLDNACIRLGL